MPIYRPATSVKQDLKLRADHGSLKDIVSFRPVPLCMEKGLGNLCADTMSGPRNPCCFLWCASSARFCEAALSWSPARRGDFKVHPVHSGAGCSAAGCGDDEQRPALQSVRDVSFWSLVHHHVFSTMISTSRMPCAAFFKDSRILRISPNRAECLSLRFGLFYLSDVIDLCLETLQ